MTNIKYYIVGTCYVQVTNAKIVCLYTPTRRRICRPLIRRNYNSFARTTMQNKGAKKAILDVVGQMLQKEVIFLCSNSHKSLLTEEPNKDLDGLVKRIICEMHNRAPTLFLLLGWAMKTRQPRSNTNILISTITSMTCKHRKASECQFQRLISLALYNGHSSKQVLSNNLFRGYF